MAEQWRRRAGAAGLALACLCGGTGCASAPAVTPSGAAAPATAAAGQPVDRAGQVAAVRRLLGRIVRLGIAPGVVVVLRRGDDTDVLTAGAADTATGAPMTSRHRFHVASMTKPMVATVVVQLVQEGSLTLDDTVEQWLPGLLRAGDRITVEQLLSHTSGLAEYNDTPADWPILRRPPVDQRALVVAAGRARRDFAPGHGQAYSNTNYAVLGLLVERVTGRSLETNLDRRIFGPLRMASASLRPSRVFEEPVAHGYVHGTDATRWDLTWGWAAGGLVSDAPDVDRFFAGLFDGDLVAPAVVDEMAEPVADDLGLWSGYGLGLAELATPCGKAVGHTGVVDGFVSAAYTRRREHVAVVVMVNTDRDLSTGLLHDVVETGLCGP